MYQVQSSPKQGARAVLTHPSSTPLLGRFWYCVFIHEIDRRSGCPGTNWKIDGLTNFRFKRLSVRNSDGFHFHQSATVEGLDLKHVTSRDDFAGFFIGATANSGSCTQKALKYQHGFLLIKNQKFDQKLLLAIPVESMAGFHDKRQ